MGDQVAFVFMVLFHCPPMGTEREDICERTGLCILGRMRWWWI